MMDLVIKNGLVCTENGVIKGGIAIKDGIIQEIASDEMLPDAKTTYDAKGQIVFPGIIEPHSHLGLQDLTPETYVSNLKTETRAAAQGGVTTLNTTTLFGSPPIQEKLDIAIGGTDKIYSDVKFYVAPGNEDHLKELPALFEQGVTAFKFLLAYRGEGAKIFGMDEAGLDTAFMYNAFREVGKLGGSAFAMIHAEDPAIFEFITPEVMEEETDNYLAAFNKARPNITEAIDLAKGAYIARDTNCHLYVVHISAHETVDLLKFFKEQGMDITGETCIHYLMHSCDDEIFRNNDDLAKFAKVNPAIRKDEDRERLWKAINEGVITCVGTDHVAFTRDKKLDPGFWETSPGCGDGLSVLLPLMFSEGVTKGRITLDMLRKILCENPAKAFGIYPKKGTIAVGSDADIVIIDPDKEMTIDYKESESSNEFSIYQDWKVKGVPTATFLRGHLVAENYKIVDEEPRGKIIKEKFPVRM